jgi:hypothetical protein
LSAALAWWRHLALGAAVAGLLLAPAVDPVGPWAAVTAVAVPALAALRPRPASGAERVRPTTAASWLALLLATGVLAGLGVGDARLAALAGRAADGEPGQRVHARGHVVAPPKRSLGEWRFPLQTGDGRLFVVAPASGDGQLAIGDPVAATGILAEPEPWRAGELARAGAALELRAHRLRRRPGGRGGLGGLLDRTRDRAERGIEAGLDDREAALARGFVLGQDDRIDERTRESFRRSGLAHLLRSYQKVRTFYWSTPTLVRSCSHPKGGARSTCAVATCSSSGAGV